MTDITIYKEKYNKQRKEIYKEINKEIYKEIYKYTIWKEKKTRKVLLSKQRELKKKGNRTNASIALKSDGMSE